MQYFSNVALAKLHGVSEGTVRRWIEAARTGKNDLQLIEHNGKPHVANTTKNALTIEDLVRRGKKHRNARWHKEVSPKPAFYKLYDKKQVLDIISDLSVHHEIPLQYGYFGIGATHWDRYAHRLWKEEAENNLTATIQLLHSNLENIRRFSSEHDRVNIIDLGVGNALPVKELLTHLLYEENVLGRYIGVDMSEHMLKIAERNITNWFKGRVNFESHKRDITYERFDDLLIDEDPDNTTNIVLLLGGTISNFRNPEEVLKTIYHSLGRNDLLVITTKLDSDEARRYFDFNAESGVVQLAGYFRLLIDLLNIDEDLYEVESFYDDKRKARFTRLRLDADLTINFELQNGVRKVRLKKDDTLYVWRAWHQTVGESIEQLEDNGFALLETSATADRQYLLTISQLNTDV